MLDDKPLLALVGLKRKTNPREAYRRFVETGLSGSESSPAQADGLGKPAGKMPVQTVIKPEDPRRDRKRLLRQVSTRIEPKEVVHRVALAFGVEEESLFRRAYRGDARAAAVYMLMRHSRMTQRAVTEFLEFGTPAAVCRQVARLRQRMGVEPELNAGVRRLSEALASPD